MTPLGMRSLSRPAVTEERHARVANLGRVFHQVGPFESLDTTPLPRSHPAPDSDADTSLERCGCGLRNGVVLLSRSAADTDRTDDLAVLLQRDATSKNHDLAVVGSVDSKELIAGL